MLIEYRELLTDEDFTQCITLQKEIFGFSDVNCVSPLFLKLIARNNPPVGISLGLFVNRYGKSELIGFIIGFASFIEKSIHAVLMGIINEFQDQGLGRSIYLEFRKRALERDIHYMYGIFDPIESQLAYIYFSKLGFTGIKYEPEAYKLSNTDILNDIPIDKLLIKWDFLSEEVISKINGTFYKNSETILQEVPVANTETIEKASKILIQIPDSFSDLKLKNFEEAKNWRLSTRKIFTQYINNRNYRVIDCFSNKTPSGRKTYYLLEKANENE